MSLKVSLRRWTGPEDRRRRLVFWGGAIAVFDHCRDRWPWWPFVSALVCREPLYRTLAQRFMPAPDEKIAARAASSSG